jgi:hypothetical protein
MTGSLRVKKSRYYIVINYKNENGGYRQKSIPTGLMEKGNKRKAEQMLRDTIKELEEKNVVFTKEVLFADFIADWLKVVRTLIRANTFVAYSVNVNKHIIPYFRELGVTLQKLQPLHLQKFMHPKWKRG